MTHDRSAGAPAQEASAAPGGMPSDGTSAFVQHLSSTDPAELASHIPGWDVELVQLQPGRFSGRVMLISLGPLLISTGHFDQPLLMRFSAPKGCVTVNRPGRGSAPPRYLGHEVQTDECFINGPSAQVEGVTGPMLFPSALSMRMDALQTAQVWLGESKIPSVRGTQLRRAGPAWTNEFLDGMEWIIDAVSQHPEALDRADVRASLADMLMARINVLSIRESPLKENRQARIHRRAAVERAREFIHRNLSEPIRLSHLCQYARTEARALEYGFRDVVGLSPMAYVRNTRLHRARRMLRSDAVLRSSISEIAMDCGFWHLSQFATDYKTLFGESPSITFRRTQAELPARVGRAPPRRARADSVSSA